MEKLKRCGAEWPQYEKDNPRSIYMGVMRFLEFAGIEPVFPEDSDFIIDFLNTPPGQEKEAWDRWEKYWEAVDMEERFERARRGDWKIRDSSKKEGKQT